MAKIKMKIIATVLITALIACGGIKKETTVSTAHSKVFEGDTTSNKNGKVTKTEVQWRQLLTPEQYNVTREKGTERAFTGKYYDHHEKGTYACVCCNAALFDSKTKFESGTGWPSFFQPIDKNAISNVVDDSYGMIRTENTCSTCNAHLGHSFDDGPEPTGIRYCINSASLKFIKSK